MCFKFRFWFPLLALGLVLQGCTRGAEETKPLRIVATVGPIADWSRHVGGRRVQVYQVVPAHVNPRTYRLSGDDQREIEQADVVVLNGLGLEPWLESFFDGHPPRRSIVVDLSQFITPATRPTVLQHPQLPPVGEASDVEPVLPQSMEDTMIFSPPVYSTYQWLDPSAARKGVQFIAQAMARVDPAHMAVYIHNEAAYGAEIENMDHVIQRTLDRFPHREMIDLNNFLEPYRSHFKLESSVFDPAVTTNEKTPTLDDALSQHDGGSNVPPMDGGPVSIDPLSDDSYLTLLQNVTRQVVVVLGS
ncbi:MAG: hypothetical protein NVS2B7_17630 [Herpetosiphon sp.]